MHSLYVKADAMSFEVIGAAMEVHRDKGPGLIESIYERCLMHELSLRHMTAVNQKLLNIPVGLLINFHEVVLKNGIARLLLPGANLP